MMLDVGKSNATEVGVWAWAGAGCPVAKKRARAAKAARAMRTGMRPAGRRESPGGAAAWLGWRRVLLLLL